MLNLQYNNDKHTELTEIVDKQRYEFDDTDAILWAIEHKHYSFLALKAAAFQKTALTLDPSEILFMKIETEPTVQMKRKHINELVSK